MNRTSKKTKALVAGGLGLALLLGTAGTFAMWFDTADLADDRVATGHLEVETSIRWRTTDDTTLAPEAIRSSFDRGIAHWVQSGTGHILEVETPGLHPDLGFVGNPLWVPGDWAIADIEATVSMAGQNLVATLTVDGPANADVDYLEVFLVGDRIRLADDATQSPDADTVFIDGSYYRANGQTGADRAPGRVQVRMGEPVELEITVGNRDNDSTWTPDNDGDTFGFQLWIGFPTFRNGFAADSAVFPLDQWREPIQGDVPFTMSANRHANAAHWLSNPTGYATIIDAYMWGAGADAGMNLSPALDLGDFTFTLLQVPHPNHVRPVGS